VTDREAKPVHPVADA